MNVKNKLINIAVLLSVVNIFMFGAQDVLATTYVSDLQTQYPQLSDEDAMYVSQQMEFNAVDMAEQAVIDKYVSERLAHRASQATTFPTRLTGVESEENGPGTYKVSFTLKNDGVAQSGIRYRINLRSLEVDGGGSPDYATLYPEVLTVPADGVIKRTVDFTVPSYIPAGDYIISVELGGEHGNVFAMINDSRLINVTNGTDQLSVDFTTCGVEINDGTEGLFTLSEGIDIASTEDLYLVCKITAAKDTTVNPYFTSFARNTWGEQIGERSSGAAINLRAGTAETVRIKLPTETRPQAYDVKVDLEVGGKSVVEPIVAHYVVQGESATIQSVTMDSTDALATIYLAWTGSADAFPGSRAGSDLKEAGALTAEVSLMTLSGQVCSPNVTQALDTETEELAVIPVPLMGECADKVAMVKIKNASGTVLAEDTYNFAVVDEEEATAPVPTTEATSNKNMVYLVALGALIALITIILLVRKKRVSHIVASWLIVVTSFGVSALVYAGSFDTGNYAVWETSSGGYWSSQRGTITFAGPAGTFTNPAQAITFTGRADNFRCANTATRSNFSLTVDRMSPSGSVRIAWNGSTNVATRRDDDRDIGWRTVTYNNTASALGNGVYQATIEWQDGFCDIILNGRRDPRFNRSLDDSQCDRNPTQRETFYFTVAIDPPAVPASITATCSPLANNPVALSWPAVTSATHYALRVDYPSDPAPHLVQIDNHPGTSYNTFIPTAGTAYSAWVHACSASGCSVAAASTNFTCNPLPVVTLDADPVNIGRGEDATLRWTVDNASSCTASGPGWNGSKNTAGGNETITPPGADTYTLTCTGAGGSASDSVTIINPSGDIGATSCPIPLEGTSCTTRVNWNSNNFIGGTEVTQGSAPTPISTARNVPLPGNQYTVNPDNNIFYLRDAGSNFEDQAMATVTCLDGGTWVSTPGLCVGVPVIDIIPTPSLIRSGEQADLRITIDSPYRLTCEVIGGVNQTFSHDGITNRNSVRELRTNPLKAAQIVSLSCALDLYPSVVATDEARVNVVPAIQEI